MRGWILYRRAEQELDPCAYEINRLREAAVRGGVDLRVVRPEHFQLLVGDPNSRTAWLDGEEVALPDFLLPRMGAGTTYFALAVIRHLERLGVPAFNSAASVATVRDKLYTQQVLAASGLPSVKTMLVKFPVDPACVERSLGFPVVLKPVSGSHGRGVFLCQTAEQLEDVVGLIMAGRATEFVLIQEFVSASRGRDLRVFTLGGRPVACMQRTATVGFRANVSRGATVTAHPMTPKIERLASEASRLFGLEIAGVDLLFREDGFAICEVNSSPGFRGLEECHSIDIAGAIFAHVRERLSAAQGRSGG